MDWGVGGVKDKAWGYLLGLLLGRVEDCALGKAPCKVIGYQTCSVILMARLRAASHGSC